LRTHLNISLKALQLDKIDLYYLHAPDRTTPFEETLREVNALHKEGFFNRWGLSNFAAWEVAQVCGICEKNSWIKPTVYQGGYNALHRSVEPELIPCLRAHGISFYAYSPLGGGIMTGKHSQDGAVEKGSHFDPETLIGKIFRARYFNEKNFAALGVIKPAAEKHGLKLPEVALQWLTHHSVLKREFGDAIIIGASTATQLEHNLLDLEKGSLPEEILAKLQEAYEIVKPVQASYFF